MFFFFVNLISTFTFIYFSQSYFICKDLHRSLPDEYRLATVSSYFITIFRFTTVPPDSNDNM